MAEKNPEISIVIPMYNAEKYIGECLDSLVAQTFQDFEVIIVDDCSTDKSCEIAESYASTLNITLIPSEKNFGYPGLTRNRGIEKARGKYVCFIDCDDAIIDNSLMSLYNLAEHYHADIVHCDRFLRAPEDTVSTDRAELKVSYMYDREDIPELIFLTDDIEKRIEIFRSGKFAWEPWSHFIRRDYLTKNQLKIPSSMNICDDLVFTITMLATAKKIILLPHAFYVWRQRKSSVSRSKWASVEKGMKQIGNDIIQGIEFLDKFFSRNKFFTANPKKKFDILKFFLEFETSGEMVQVYEEVPLNELEKPLRRVFKKVGDITASSAFFFNYINLLKSDRKKLLDENAELKNLAVQQQQKINSLIEDNELIRKFGMKMIEQLHRAQIEVQNLKSPLNNESTETFFNFIGK